MPTIDNKSDCCHRPRTHPIRSGIIGFIVGVGLLVCCLYFMPHYGSPSYGTHYHEIYKEAFDIANYPVTIAINFMGRHGWIFTEQNIGPILIAMGIYWGGIGALVATGISAVFTLFRRLIALRASPE